MIRAIISLVALFIVTGPASGSVISYGMKFHAPTGTVVGTGSFSFDTSPEPFYMLYGFPLEDGSGFYGKYCYEYAPGCEQLALVHPLISWQANIGGIEIEGGPIAFFAEGQVDYHDPRQPETSMTYGNWSWDNDPCWALGTCTPSQYFGMAFSQGFHMPATFYFDYDPTLQFIDPDVFQRYIGKVTFHRIPDEVPLPAAAWLFLTGVGGIAIRSGMSHKNGRSRHTVTA